MVAKEDNMTKEQGSWHIQSMHFTGHSQSTVHLCPLKLGTKNGNSTPQVQEMLLQIPIEVEKTTGKNGTFNNIHTGACSAETTVMPLAICMHSPFSFSDL